MARLISLSGFFFLLLIISATNAIPQPTGVIQRCMKYLWSNRDCRPSECKKRCFDLHANNTGVSGECVGRVNHFSCQCNWDC
ncbi:hypothetical protein SAY87_012231 [Trapa incisa]|uniref:Uncharacterized protein n=1 Tax=Trapa incisa TaxID=236973 RepID=A0AAN7GXK0_9MYRT|nr:hypothetical protein SAY87_012231 [Trapa incisa]